MRRSTIGWLAAAAVVALVAGISAVWPGLDAQRTPVEDTSAWVLQADGLRYARVNAAIGELDTVRSVSNPSRIAQTGTAAYLFTDSDSRAIRIDEAAPVDLDAQTLRAAVPAPPGTVDVDTAGDFVAYRTDSGAVYAGRLSTGALAEIDPRANADVGYASDAIAVDAAGRLFSYSAADTAVIRVDIDTADVRAEDVVSDEVAAPVLTAAGERWVLVESGTGRYWTADVDAAPAQTVGAVVVSRPDADGAAVHVADQTGLVRISLPGATAERVFGDRSTARGTPARPITRDGVVHAAWLPEGAGPGTLWTSTGADVSLDYGGLSLPSQRRPVFAEAGAGLVLNDARSGWVWSVPGGALVPSSQDWSLDEEVATAQTVTEEEPPPVIDPRPPVAVADAFGVRPGALVTLPVLLNDHDPNEDVLTVDPASVTGLDPAFGTLTLTDDRQRLAVRVAADATGSASFSYAVTDGTAPDGLVSGSAPVALTVTGADTAPQWCGVEGCQQEWPSPELARGGTLRLPVLGDWVDPEGDPVLLLSAEVTAGSGHVMTTPEGEVVFAHQDGGGSADEMAAVTLSVSDTRGQTATKQLTVRVAASAQPTLQSFAVVDTAGARLSVDVAGHLTGAAGTASLSSARVLDAAAATATVVGGSTRFDFSADAPGVYRVAVTVAAGGQEVTGTVRITLLAPDAPAELATAPVVAFVRPQADATVDVFAAVANPTGRVLLLSEVAAAAAPGASLRADAVGQSQLRVSGATATGQAGLLGTVSYRVSDGTDDAGSAVVGTASVYLLPPAPEVAPIAVDDTVVVRVGAQVDVPILANDVAPAGTRPRLDPESIVSSSPDALAFASGDVLRYLAPDEPGEHTVRYRVFANAAQAAGDDAVVRVTVVAAGANRDPVPPAQSGRVLSGLSTTIPVGGAGMDPDGDTVRLESIVTQPERGSATVSADGTAIVYTGVAGASGQEEFTYRVVDGYGGAGEGRVRVGVLSGDANPSPITYTDYVSVQAGADSVIRVHPLAGDIDPMQGTLRLVRVRPDLPEQTLDGAPSTEYTRVAGHIRSVTDDTVAITAGTEAGTMSFLYDVESSSGNTARGLIVVRVVERRVPDYPVVADTVLTAEDRERFTTGVDVLAGTVRWSGGETDTLEVGLWGSAPGVEVTGSRLSGTLTDRAQLIAFSVTGQTASGPVTTYGFLRVPGTAELALTLRAGTAPLAVDEGGEASVDLAGIVARPRGSVLEVGDEVRAAGSRPAGSCARGPGTTIRYAAGQGAPWTDACLVLVRMAGQSAWTVLSVPVTVTPGAPQPVLGTASLEIGPGEEYAFDLASLTTWRGRAEPIAYRVDGATSSFEVALAGTILTVRGRDDALPGAAEFVVVEATSHDGVAPGRVNLRVGAAPSTLPAGGTAAAQCSQAAGSGCTIEVIGAPGEVNPLPATALELVSVAATSSCAGVSFTVAGTTAVRAEWSAGAAGATCTAAFTVADAQGRQSAAARDGRLTLDLHGFPPAAAGVAQSDYADGSVTLQVDPGAAQTAYPALTGFEVSHDGTVVAACTAQGACAPIAAPNGEQRRYEVAARNDVGRSAATVATTAWAYDPPARPAAVDAVPVVTEGGGGVAALTVRGVDAADTASLEISSPAGETITVPVAEGQTDVVVPVFRVGANTATPVTVTPRSRFEVPPGLVGPAPESITATAHGVGAPTGPVLNLSAVNTGDGTVEVTATGAAGAGGDGAGLRYGIVPEGRACRTTDGGDRAVFGGLPDGRLYRFTLCVESVYADQVYGRVETTGEVRAVQSGAAPTGYTFTVGPTPHLADGRATWTIESEPTSPVPLPNDNVARFDGFPSAVFDGDPGIRVRYEHTAGWWQSAWGSVTPAPGSAPAQLQARWWLGGTCTGGARLDPQHSSSLDRARFTLDTSAIAYRDAAGALLPVGADPLVVPAAAVRVDGIRITADWSAQGWGLDPATGSLSATCTPVPPTAEEPAR